MLLGAVLLHLVSAPSLAPTVETLADGTPAGAPADRLGEVDLVARRGGPVCGSAKSDDTFLAL